MSAQLVSCLADHVRFDKYRIYKLTLQAHGVAFWWNVDYKQHRYFISRKLRDTV